MSDNLSREEIEHVVEQTVIKTLGQLGIDLSTPEARKEFIEDQYSLRAWRKARDRVGKMGLTTAIGVIVTGALGLIWLGLQVLLHGHPVP